MINLISEYLVYTLLRLNHASLVAKAAHFFIYETIKIFILLSVIIFIVSMVRTFFPAQKIRKILSGWEGPLAYIAAALFGIITPFCSCSAVALFLGFVEVGVPLGVTFSFLVASPMINEIALVMLWSLFGWKVATIYIFSGLVIAVISGVVIGKLNVDNLLEASASDGLKSFPGGFRGTDWIKRTQYAGSYVWGVIRKVWLYIVFGIGAGAWMHGYVPDDFLARYAGRDNWLAVPVAVLTGIPLYSGAAGVMPLVKVLTEKGVGMGTALAFMMAVTGLSLPEFVILRRMMKVRLIAIFSGIVGLGILFTGYTFNLIIR